MELVRGFADENSGPKQQRVSFAKGLKTAGKSSSQRRALTNITNTPGKSKSNTRKKKTAGKKSEIFCDGVISFKRGRDAEPRTPPQATSESVLSPVVVEREVFFGRCTSAEVMLFHGVDETPRKGATGQKTRSSFGSDQSTPLAPDLYKRVAEFSPSMVKSSTQEELCENTESTVREEVTLLPAPGVRALQDIVVPMRATVVEAEAAQVARVVEETAAIVEAVRLEAESVPQRAVFCGLRRKAKSQFKLSLAVSCMEREVEGIDGVRVVEALRSAPSLPVAQGALHLRKYVLWRNQVIAVSAAQLAQFSPNSTHLR